MDFVVAIIVEVLIDKITKNFCLANSEMISVPGSTESVLFHDILLNKNVTMAHAENKHKH